MKCEDDQWIWSKKKGENIGGLIMLIVKKYHTETVKEWEQIKQEEEKRRAGLTEKEIITEQEQRHR